ncbi:3-dehydro-L-gulonate 2-dehydrogenase [Oscillospiraceae bacterium PP1C4]
MRIPFEQMKAEIKRAMKKAGLSEEQADICAQVHTESSRDGVYSHGLNRVPRFIKYVGRGWVNLEGKPELMKAVGCMENYDGHLGIGIMNAKFCMNRAMELAKAHGIGVITLRNTTHWMRGGTYAWDAANAGYLAMCWTNTESCMPAWGAKVPCIGNNPFCIGIPRKAGNVVLDMAMSQYSYGKLQVTRLAGEQLPYPGGFDKDGSLTSDPGSIEESRRILPTGYWKGSGLAVALDMAAAILSNGLPASEIDKVGKGSCGGCSQIFIAFNPHLFGSEAEIEAILESSIDQLHNAAPEKKGGRVTFPGERTVETRNQSNELGVLADETVWNDVCNL